MDKIDALISNFETMVSLDARCNVWVAPGKLDTARAALRAEFDAQAARIAELEKEVHDVSVYLNKNHAPVVDWNLKPGYAAVELLKKFYSEKVELKSELAALKEAQRWIPVEDELPEKSQNYLVCAIFPTGAKPFIDACYYVRSFGFADFGAKITHWQPLPQPPEVE